MKIIILKNKMQETSEQFLRKAGYFYIRDKRSGKESFSKRLGAGFYPRLHMYVKEQGDKIIFDLHLDQKQASYSGQRMHSGEYNGEVVEQEIKRLKELMSSFSVFNSDFADNENSHSTSKSNNAELPTEINKKTKFSDIGKKSFWKRLFS